MRLFCHVSGNKKVSFSATQLIITAIVMAGVHGAARADVVAAASAAQASPASGKGLDKLKCPDIANLQEQAETLIMREISAQQSTVKKTKPAYSYEQDPQHPRNSRLKSQVREVAKALVAAINNPQSPARTASFALNGDAKRRASMRVYAQCYGEQLKEVIENSRFDQNIGRCSQGDGPVSTGLNATQVFQTNNTPEQVEGSFTRKIVEPSEGTTVASCMMPNCGRYQQRLPNGFPQPGKDYVFRTTREFGFGFNMANETAVRVTKIPLCNSEISLVSVLGLPQRPGDKGFDSTTMVGVIAPVGNKTLVFGSFSAQSFRTSGDEPMPITFLKYHDRYISDIFDKYNTVASIVGSVEKATNGLLGGSPELVPAARLSSGSSERTAQ